MAGVSSLRIAQSKPAHNIQGKRAAIVANQVLEHLGNVPKDLSAQGYPAA
jgi:hypothetical protein